jgi:competence protein ComEA
MLLGALLLVVGYWWWQGRARPVVTIPEPVASAGALPDAQPLGEVIVHVRGRVVDPGVFTLAAGSRVVDAIEAAGGVRAGASIGDLNLARVLVDGEQVAVGVKGAQGDPSGQPAGGTDSGSSGGPAGGSSGGGELLDLNAATASELEELPGIGPVLAERIVQWREDNGRFTDVEVLGEVSGIGDALMAQLRPLVRVG